MAMTPRQVAAFLHFLDRQEAAEEARAIGVHRLAQYGEKKDVESHLKTLGP
jgi:hypothetical protein